MLTNNLYASSQASSYPVDDVLHVMNSSTLRLLTNINEENNRRLLARELRTVPSIFACDSNTKLTLFPDISERDKIIGWAQLKKLIMDSDHHLPTLNLSLRYVSDANLKLLKLLRNKKISVNIDGIMTLEEIIGYVKEFSRELKRPDKQNAISRLKEINKKLKVLKQLTLECFIPETIEEESRENS